MSKVLISINNIEQLHNIELYDACIIGINDLSINVNSFSMDDLVTINNLCIKYNKELFLALNKNMHSKDMELLISVLKLVKNYQITGILFYDLCFMTLKDELDINTPLFIAQEHSVTNYGTINFYNKQNIKGSLLSSEITLEEIKEIRNNTNSKLILQVFGHIPMFASKRHLVNNYMETFNLNNNSKLKYMYKEDKYYPVIDNNNGTIVYSANIMDGLKESRELSNIEYIYFNSFNLSEDTFKKVLNNYKNGIDNIDDMFNNLDKGFLYKETIYKVKKNG